MTRGEKSASLYWLARVLPLTHSTRLASSQFPITAFPVNEGGWIPWLLPWFYTFEFAMAHLGPAFEDWLHKQQSRKLPPRWLFFSSRRIGKSDWMVQTKLLLGYVCHCLVAVMLNSCDPMDHSPPASRQEYWSALPFGQGYFWSCNSRNQSLICFISIIFMESKRFHKGHSEWCSCLVSTSRSLL